MYSNSPVPNLPSAPKSQSLYSNTSKLSGIPNTPTLYNNSPTLPSGVKLNQMYANVAREESEQGSQYSNYPSRSASAMSNASVTSSRQGNKVLHNYFKFFSFKIIFL